MPTTCVQRKYLQEVNIYGVDDCGRIVLDTPSALFGLSYRQIMFADAITEGDQETVTDVTGATCITDKACPTDEGEDITLDGCGTNFSLRALLGLGRVAVNEAGDVIGYDRTAISCVKAVAIELVWRPDGTCEEGEDPQCPVTLYPYVKNWFPSGDRTVDGKTTMFDSWKGRADLNGRLFQDGIPTELAHWAPYEAIIEAGDAYSIDRLMVCPDAKTADCDLQTITGPGS